MAQDVRMERRRNGSLGQSVFARSFPVLKPLPLPLQSVNELPAMQGTDRCYHTLIGADMYRDGGSLEARFALADGQFETLWLQAAPDSPRDHQVMHSFLLVYPDVDRNAPSIQIEPNSPEEDSIRAAIEMFLANPSVSVPFSHKTPDDYYLGRLRELALAIPKRTNEAEPQTAQLAPTPGSANPT